MAGPESDEKMLFEIAPETTNETLEFQIEERIELPPTPNSEEVLSGLVRNALVLIDNAEYRSAMRILHHVLQRDSEYPDAIKWLGYCFSQLNQRHNSLKCYRAFVKVAPGEESYSLLGEESMEDGDYETALEFYRKALEVIDYESANLFHIYKNLGNIYVRSGQFESAEENYNKAYTLNPHSDDLYVNIGTLEIQKGDFDKGLAHFREALTLNQQNDKAWVGVGLIHSQMGDAELAWANVEKALDINPKNKTAIGLLFTWCEAQDKLVRTKELAKTYLAEQPDDFDSRFALAALYIKLGEVEKAEDEIEGLYILSPDNPRIGEIEEALNTLKQEVQV